MSVTRAQRISRAIGSRGAAGPPGGRGGRRPRLGGAVGRPRRDGHRRGHRRRQDEHQDGQAGARGRRPEPAWPPHRLARAKAPHHLRGWKGGAPAEGRTAAGGRHPGLAGRAGRPAGGGPPARRGRLGDGAAWIWGLVDAIAERPFPRRRRPGIRWSLGPLGFCAPWGRTFSTI